MDRELLTLATVRNAKPGDKELRLNDGGGLYLLIKPNGAKWWRFDYRIEGKLNTLSFGVYPAAGLADARRKAETARNQLIRGIDPGATQKNTKAAQRCLNKKHLDAGINSFEQVAREWLASIATCVRDITYENKIRRFEQHVFPALGRMPIGKITSTDIYNAIKPLIVTNELDIAHRTHSEISTAFAYAIAHGFTDYDPAQAVAAQLPAQTGKHRAALTEPKDLAQLLRNISNYQGSFVVQCALRLSALLFQFPSEIRQMEWTDIDFNAKEWRYFVTKTEVQHIVPLSVQALALLKEIKPLTGNGRYVFPSSGGAGRPMPDDTLLTALETLGYDSNTVTAHEFRTIAAKLLNQQGWSPDALARQLSRMPGNAVSADYNREQYLEERRRLMQSWADTLDGLKAGAQVLPFRTPR